MSAAVAIGIGCRAGAEAAHVVALVRAALDQGCLAATNARLFTIADKLGEDGLVQASSELGMPLAFLSREVLATIVTPTQSSRVRTLYGVGSVAEGAALAGAGVGATLVVPRLARDGVTCAIARSGS